MMHMQSYFMGPERKIVSTAIRRKWRTPGVLRPPQLDNSWKDEHLR